jgi:hypothetical protein
MSLSVLGANEAVGRVSFRVPRWLAALAGFSLLTALFFWPWLAHLSSALIGPPEDNMQDFWNSWHAAHAHGWRDIFFTTDIRWPEGTALYYHSFNYPQVASIALLAQIFGGNFASIVALHNLTLLASFPLAGLGMYLLARHLMGDHAYRDTGAVLAGFVFAFNPWHVAMAMHHAHVSGIEFLPLFVLCYLRALESRSYAWVAGAGLCVALAALCCWYFLFYALYFAVFHLLYLRIHDGRWPRGWHWGAPALCFGGAALLLSPWLIPMMHAGRNPAIYYPGSNIFVADLLAFFAFPPTHLLAPLGAGVYRALTGNPWEDTTYLGLVILMIVAAALLRGGSRGLMAYALGGMVFFAVLAAGDVLHVGGWISPLHLPDVVLDRLPFFANVRTVARAMVFVYLFLGLAAAQAFVLLAEQPRSRPWLALAALLMLLDFWPVDLPSTQAACPQGAQAIAADPVRAGVLNLPRGYDEDNAYMMQAACHGHPIVQGVVARFTSTALMDRLEMRDLAVQKRQLADAHVRYVVLHKPAGPLFHWNRRDGDRAGYLRAYTAVDDTPDMTVLRVY